MITTYGKVTFSTKGQDHLVMERKHDDGHIERKVACGATHKTNQYYSDDWYEHEYEAADRVIKSGIYGCKNCQRMIVRNVSQFKNPTHKEDTMFDTTLKEIRPGTRYEYYMKPDGRTIAIRKGDCPPPDAIYMGEGDEERPPQSSKEEQYSQLTKATNYDKQLFF